MSGLFSQVGYADEVLVPPVSTAGTSVAGTIGGYPFINTLTFGSAHGLSVGDVMVLTGYTASAWNGTWMVATVPSATTLTFISTITLGTLSVHGTISSSHYGSTVAGTAITPAPARFTAFINESLKLVPERIESEGVGANRRVQLSTRGVLGKRSAAGDLKIEVESKGFGFWGKHFVGPVVTTGPTDSAYTHTFSFPSGAPVTNGRLGKSFNFQSPVVPIGGVNSELVKTYLGCKVASWQLDFEVGKLLIITANIVAMDEKRNIVKATASYAASPEPLSFAGGTIQIAGATWDTVKSGTVKVDLGLNLERWFTRASILRKEPAEEKMAAISVELNGEFTDVLTAYNRIEASAYANTIAQINLAFVGQILIGVSALPSLTFNIQAARLDGDTPTTDGAVLPVQKVTAKGLFDGTNSPMTMAYVTTDSTP
jgi:tail tube protein